MKKCFLILISIIMFFISGCVPQQQNFNPKTADYGPMPSNYIDPVKEYVKGQLHIGRHQVFVSYDKPVQGMATDQNSLSLALKGQLYGWKGYMVVENHGVKHLWEYYMRYDQVVGINSYTGPNEQKMIYSVLTSKQRAATLSAQSSSRANQKSRSSKKESVREKTDKKAAGKTDSAKNKAESAPKGNVDSDGFEIIEHEKPSPAAQVKQSGSKPPLEAPSKPKKLDADGFEILN